MTRVKRGVNALKRRKNVLAQTKGFRHGRKSKERMARTAIRKAGQHAFNDRRKKKGAFRGLWITRLNAALRIEGETYSKFIAKLTAKNVGVNRKMLSEIARDNVESFKRIVAQVK
jgi:large subunit ribosomal protein L20